jgi:hypothetical protein
MRLMAPETQSVVIRADLSAFEFREAAWAATDGVDEDGCRVPDPSTLSDRTLAIVMRYQDRDLPSRAHRAVEEEWRRRRGTQHDLGLWIGAVVLAVIGAGGLVAVWTLFTG